MLRRALELWRGPALADVRDEYFAGQEAEWLEERRLVALDERIACELTIGGDLVLVLFLQRLVDRYPFREQLVESLMQRLYRAGRQADALAAYQGARRRLAEDLGLEPGPQLESSSAAYSSTTPVSVLRQHLERHAECAVLRVEDGLSSPDALWRPSW